MTDAERFSLLFSLMPIDFVRGKPDSRVPHDAPRGAGYVPGVARLGIPAVAMTDASLGVTSPRGYRPGDTPTAFPAGASLGATFNPARARQMGEVVGLEARVRGFNVALGGGINLIREVRNGRNFEYISEDPWLSGVLGGEIVAGTQSQGVIATLKHLSLNVSESNKFWLDARIEPAAHRESDLLAFEVAIERGRPGALMCAYNKVNGEYACGNGPLLNDVVRKAWDFRGWVLSDWKAVHDWSFALQGLDQQSGAQLDAQEWFNAPLRNAVAVGSVPRTRISEMVRRVLYAYYAVGIDRERPPPSVDPEAHHRVALEIAREGIVLLRNEEDILPLDAGAKRIAIIGGHADLGVLSGAGSSQGSPPNGQVLSIPLGGEGLLAPLRTQVYFGSSPLRHLAAQLPESTVAFDSGAFPAAAAALARRSDVAIVFATRHESEGFDSPDLSLPFGQDAIIEAVAAANPRTVVVLQTGSPVAMPWRDRVAGIVQAWFPGQAGGEAIADVLTGRVNPSGRLPMTFPADVGQLPNPRLPGFDLPFGSSVSVDYHEGADVGYRWFARTQAVPLFAFGHGLSYTRFEYSDFVVSGGESLRAEVTVTNVGARAGADVPQVYLVEAAGERRQRLLGFERVALEAGESRRVRLEVDPRLLARYDGRRNRWRIDSGVYRAAVGRSAAELVLTANVRLDGRSFGR